MGLKTDKNDKDSKYYLLILTGSYLTVLGLDEPYLGITEPYLLFGPYLALFGPYFASLALLLALLYVTGPFWATVRPAVSSK